MIGLPHVLTISDVTRGIQALSQTLLGDLALWPELVSANNLIPPYLTLDPVVAYGVSLDTQATSVILAQGSLQMALTANPQLWQPGDIMVFSSSSPSGLVMEQQTVSSYDGVTLTWLEGLQNSYSPGTQVTSYSPNVVQAAILMPGQVIYLPITSTNASFVLTTNAQLTDVMGSDLLGGSMAWSSTGDLSTVSGVAVLFQRIRAVLFTITSSLPQSPAFGSRVPLSLGVPTQDLRILTYVRQALLSLPEISQVTNLSLNASGNQLFLSGQISIASSNTVLSLVNEPLTQPI